MSLSLSGCDEWDSPRPASGRPIPSYDCPKDETCSDNATQLRYAGNLGPPPLVAVGGLVKIRVESFIVSGSAFDATTGDGSVFATELVSPPFVTVRALAAGSTLLRIFEPGSTLLVDRTELTAKEISKVDLAAVDQAVPPLCHENVAGGMLRGVRSPLRVRLDAADGTTLTDGSITVEAGTGLVEQHDGSSFFYTPSTGAVAAMTVTAGAKPWPVVIPIVDAIDDIVLSDRCLERIAQARLFCFSARSGELTVTGATWAITAPEGYVVDTGGSENGCAFLAGPRGVPVTLEVDASGFRKKFEVTLEVL